MQCSAVTKKKKRCPIEARGNGLCHVHDPTGLFRQQQQAKPRPHHHNRYRTWKDEVSTEPVGWKFGKPIQKESEP